MMVFLEQIRDFWNSRNLRQKLYAIKRDMKHMLGEICSEKFSVSWYGFYESDPGNLMFIVYVQSDQAKTLLAMDQEFNVRLRHLLVKHEYPETARSRIMFRVESQETMDRESGGNWYDHFHK